MTAIERIELPLEQTETEAFLERMGAVALAAKCEKRDEVAIKTDDLLELLAIATEDDG